MLRLNDDMDDLIRQAAGDYPLKTVGSDWEKVAAGVQVAMQKEPAGNKRYWWLLLLLLPLLIAVPLYYQNKELKKQPDYSSAKTTGATMEKQGANTAINKADKAPGQSNTGNTSTSQVKKPGSEPMKNEAQLNNHFKTNTTLVQNDNEGILIGGNNRTKLNNAERNSADNHQLAPVTDVITGNHYDRSTIENNQAATKASNETKKNGTEEENTSAANSNINKDNKTIVAPAQDSAAMVKKVDLKHTTPVKTKGLYAGITGGLDVTTVKFHEVKKAGYSAALIVGYRLNNHWSIESGLMWDNKNYYSPGEYFDKSRTDIPAASYIHYLNGTCRMYEVPLNIKYDFNSKKLSGFYVSAGLSSYIMKKENYEYHATSSNGNYYVGKREYKNSTNNLFSVANISGGYQFIFKNNNSLRIEPYIKVPLKGLGIGKMPFSSTGISAAYTLPIH
jgi:hypothetical protein